MVTQEQKDRYNFQQTNTGKDVLSMCESLKKEYCLKLGVIRQIKRCLLRQIKTGFTEHLTMV